MTRSKTAGGFAHEPRRLADFQRVIEAALARFCISKMYQKIKEY